MEEKVGFFKRLKNGLSKTRDSFVSGIDSLFTGFSEIDDDFYEELEELLVMGDIGINTTMSLSLIHIPSPRDRSLYRMPSSA